MFRLGVELGAMPRAFFKAVEETVHETLRQGVYGVLSASNGRKEV